MDASMLVYQQALNEAKSPADKAKLLYTMGRLCIRLRRTREAISFFTRELEITKQELGVNHLSVSHIYHELAKLYDEGLGEQKMALMKYNKALQIELAVLQECHYAVATCERCNPIAHRMCEPHSTMHTQVTGQIRETKKSQGRMHFKLGDFDKALRTSFFNEQAPTGNGRRRAHLAHPIW
jgi:tetratricopeptide (TPR) repeat protein